MNLKLIVYKNIYDTIFYRFSNFVRKENIQFIIPLQRNTKWFRIFANEKYKI